ncbi:Mutator family transposase [Mycobacterium sp. smrl_JER01]
MTTAHNIDLPAVLAERLTTAHPDVLRELLATFIHTLMGAEADTLCGAGYGERSSERTNSRNGYRRREFDTRAGTLDLAIPKLRHGSYFLEWLLERRKRAERAPTTVVATCYLLGVSTRRMDKLVVDTSRAIAQVDHPFSVDPPPSPLWRSSATRAPSTWGPRRGMLR